MTVTSQDPSPAAAGPLTPEEFFAQHIDTDLSGFVTHDTLIKALTDYRDHLQQTWWSAHGAKERDPLQQQYDGYTVGSR